MTLKRPPSLMIIAVTLETIVTLKRLPSMTMIAVMYNTVKQKYKEMLHFLIGKGMKRLPKKYV